MKHRGRGEIDQDRDKSAARVKSYYERIRPRIASSCIRLLVPLPCQGIELSGEESVGDVVT